MKIFQFNKANETKVNQFHSDFILSQIVQLDQQSRIGCMYVDEEGIVGYHQAVMPQLLPIMSSQGLVRGESEEYIEVVAGDAVFWDKDEWHETKSSIGLTAIVIESLHIDPSELMMQK